MNRLFISLTAPETWTWSHGPGDLKEGWVEFPSDSSIARLARMTELAWNLNDESMPFGTLDIPTEHLPVAIMMIALLEERLGRLGFRALKMLDQAKVDCGWDLGRQAGDTKLDKPEATAVEDMEQDAVVGEGV
jgi:hypothetical protein